MNLFGKHDEGYSEKAIDNNIIYNNTYNKYSKPKLKHKNYEQRPLENLDNYYDNVEVSNGL